MFQSCLHNALILDHVMDGSTRKRRWYLRQRPTQNQNPPKMKATSSRIVSLPTPGLHHSWKPMMTSLVLQSASQHHLPQPHSVGARTIMTPSNGVRPPQRIHLGTPTVDPIPAPLATPAQPQSVEDATDPYPPHVPYHEHARLRHRLAALADYAGHTRIALNRLAETVGDCRDQFFDLKEYTSGVEDHEIMLADDLWDTRANVRTIWRIVVMILMVIFMVIVASLVCQFYY
ncbi:hypothetical protein QVD17_38007 [Tagetes erecta]|uniref:Uncharacterized protein n=1 Tax=Tagetes erecta TaxID=13708 RepID=A0AAD8JX51_TARER|nr:hypothetical protein QVD17_38007 [Tagetes erecta]